MHHHDIRPPAFDQRQGGLAGRGLSDNREAVFHEHAPQAGTEEGVVVDDEAPSGGISPWA